MRGARAPSRYGYTTTIDWFRVSLTLPGRGHIDGFFKCPELLAARLGDEKTSLLNASGVPDGRVATESLGPSTG